MLYEYSGGVEWSGVARVGLVWLGWYGNLWAATGFAGSGWLGWFSSSAGASWQTSVAINRTRLCRICCTTMTSHYGIGAA